MRENLVAKRVKIVGAIASYAFQRAKCFAHRLHRSMPFRFPQPEIEGLLEVEWHRRLTEWRHLRGPEFCRLQRPVAVFLDDTFIGSDVEFLRLANLGHIFVEGIPLKSSHLVCSLFREDYLTRLKSAKLTYCYFDICVDEDFIGTIVFQLYSDILPRTCANFVNLCLGTRGNFLSYKGSRIHRIVKDGWLQGGDIQYKTGGGGFSTYCNPLEDETYGISHDRRGVLSMANIGKHSNGSQFFITLNPSSWMDTYYVAFGQVIEGVNVLSHLEGIDTFRECPLQKIEIKNCGKLDLEDVFDTDARYTPDESRVTPEKEPKKIETIADQLVRLIMEAVTECLAIKEHVPDTVHVGDAPTVTNIDYFFRGLYSLSEEVLEHSAKHLRTLRRQMFRHLRQSATEVVEVLTYDLLGGVFTKLVDLDNIREATGHPIYNKLVDGIDMEVEIGEKPHVKKFVDQLVTTAETMVKLISLRLNWTRKNKVKTQVFQKQMTDWIMSFAKQETFADDNFRIAERPEFKFQKKLLPCDPRDDSAARQKKKIPSKRAEKPCCRAKKEEPREKPKKKVGVQQTPVDICCYGKEESVDEIVTVDDFFSTCIYSLKKKEREAGQKLPLLDLIETGRYKLRIIRGDDTRLKSRARICLEKRINQWMKDVVYTPETDWIRQTVFKKEEICFRHTEEMLYGAMTIGLLEMYFLLEEHLKKPKKRYRTRVIYRNEDDFPGKESSALSIKKEGNQVEQFAPGESPCSSGSSEEEVRKNRKKKHRPCTCGDICCDCTSAPEESDEYEDDKNVHKVPIQPTPPPPSPAPSEPVTEESCPPSTIEIDTEELLTQIMNGAPVDISSFKWMKEYILHQGCTLKSEFASQVHGWLENEVFSFRGFLSKHSLVTRASLLSFSLSLASLIREENDLKAEVKDFIYDLWELYFNEMFKEAQMEFPPESKETGDEDEGEESGDTQMDGDRDPCSRVKETFDFEKFCREHAGTEVMETASVPLQTMKQDEEEEEEEATSQSDAKPPEKEPATTEAPKPPESVAGEGDSEMSSGPGPRLALKLTPKVEDATRQQEQVEGLATESPRKMIVRELIPSSREIRIMPPYVLPFWIKFLTEVTKRALGLIAKMSRLPRRLYFATDSQISFDDKMKEWIEYNEFASPGTGGKDLRDFIADHHASIEDLDATARSFLRKKIVTQLMERSTRDASAHTLAEDLLVDVVADAVGKTERTGSTDAAGRIAEAVLEDLSAVAAKVSRRSEIEGLPGEAVTEGEETEIANDE